MKMHIIALRSGSISATNTSLSMDAQTRTQNSFLFALAQPPKAKAIPITLHGQLAEQCAVSNAGSLDFNFLGGIRRRKVTLP